MQQRVAGIEEDDTGKVVGAGRTEIARAIFGIDPIDEGAIFIDNRQVKIRSPKDAINAGIGFVPENRKEQGLLLNMTVSDNLTINILGELSRLLLIDRKKALTIARAFMLEPPIGLEPITYRLRSDCSAD